MVVYDLSREETFASVKKWLEDIRSRTLLQNGRDIPVILVGNKADKTITNSIENVKEFCKENRILQSIHTSAKNNVNLHLAMDILIEEMMKNHFERDDSSFDLRDMPEATTTKSCCFK